MFTKLHFNLCYSFLFPKSVYKPYMEENIHCIIYLGSKQLYQSSRMEWEKENTTKASIILVNVYSLFYTLQKIGYYQMNTEVFIVLLLFFFASSSAGIIAQYTTRYITEKNSCLHRKVYAKKIATTPTPSHIKQKCECSIDMMQGEMCAVCRFINVGIYIFCTVYIVSIYMFVCASRNMLA